MKSDHSVGQEAGEVIILVKGLRYLWGAFGEFASDKVLDVELDRLVVNQIALTEVVV